MKTVGPSATYFLLVQKVGKDTLRGLPAPVALRAPGGPPKDPLFTGEPYTGIGHKPFRRMRPSTRVTLFVLPPAGAVTPLNRAHGAAPQSMRRPARAPSPVDLPLLRPAHEPVHRYIVKIRNFDKGIIVGFSAIHFKPLVTSDRHTHASRNTILCQSTFGPQYL